MEIDKLAEGAKAQIAVYPQVAGKEKLKRFVKGTLLHHKQAPVDPFSWPNAMLGEGLLAAYSATGNQEYLTAVTDHLKRWKKTGFSFCYVDNLMNGSLAFETEELILKKEVFLQKEQEEILALCKETQNACAEWVRKVPKTEQGILYYRDHHPQWLLADTVGMVSPFLCKYGIRYQDEALLELGKKQIFQFLKKGMDAKTGLPYHGYDEKNGMKYGIIGWGRACGWLMKGISESLAVLPKDDEDYESLSKALGELIEAAFAYQRPDGGFSWQLQALEGHTDSSAGGMIGCALELFCKEDTKNAEDMLKSLKGALENSCTESVVKDCSGVCRDFAEYPQIYGTFPWGTGSVLRFFAKYRED